MRALKKFKLSLPNTGLMFIIAGMAVANYSYENYQRKYMSASTKNVDTAKSDISAEGLDSNAFIPRNSERLPENNSFGNINISNDEHSAPKSDQQTDTIKQFDSVTNDKILAHGKKESLHTKHLHAKRLEKKVPEEYVKANYI